MSRMRGLGGLGSWRGCCWGEGGNAEVGMRKSEVGSRNAEGRGGARILCSGGLGYSQAGRQQCSAW